MKPLRFILVGLGARSKIWQKVLGEHPDCLIVGLVETDPERLSMAVAAAPGTVGGASLEELAAERSEVRREREQCSAEAGALRHKIVEQTRGRSHAFCV